MGCSESRSERAISGFPRADLWTSRGLWPNLLKVAPSMATSFFVYETVKTTITEHMQTL